MLVGRRGFLGLLGVTASALAAGCGAAAPPAAAGPEGPALHTGKLTDLLPLSQLRWLVVTKPREIAQTAFLIPAIATVAPEENLGRFTASSGLDLRQLEEAIVAAYGGEGGESMVYVVRHRASSEAVERLFRARITSGEHRVIERDVVRVTGKIGTTPAALTAMGGDVACFQFGGSTARGPARIAALYATEKLKKSPTVLSEDPLAALSTRLGGAPAKAFAIGPFEGELSRGARGLLAGATALGASVRPSAREGIFLVVAVAGDFTTSAEAASLELERAWSDLAKGSFGHLLALDQPITAPIVTHAKDAVSLAVELHPDRVAKGLAEATGTRLSEIMR